MRIIDLYNESDYADLLQIYSRALRVWGMPQRDVGETIATLEVRLEWLREVRAALERHESGSDRPVSVEVSGPADEIIHSHIPADLEPGLTRREILATEERFDDILRDWDINPCMCWQTMASIMDERALWLRRQVPVLRANDERMSELRGKVVRLRR